MGNQIMGWAERVWWTGEKSEQVSSALSPIQPSEGSGLGLGIVCYFWRGLQSTLIHCPLEAAN